MTSTGATSRSPAIIPSRTVSTRANHEDDDGKIHEIVQRALHEITLLSPQKQAAVGGLSGM